MRPYHRNSLIVSLLTVFLLGCEGKFESNVDLKAAVLILPENNSQCLGTKLPSGQISVQFDWEDVEGVNSFLLEYEDAVSGEQYSELVSESGINLDLDPRTLYNWKVTVSDDFGNTKTSSEFNFYTEGVAEANHVPFPPNLELTNNGDDTVTLSWQSTDLDSDIDYYKVFFSPNDPPNVLIEQTNQTSTTVAIEPGKMYYFEVITFDVNGNFSNNRMILNF